MAASRARLVPVPQTPPLDMVGLGREDVVVRLSARRGRYTYVRGGGEDERALPELIADGVISSEGAGVGVVC